MSKTYSVNDLLGLTIYAAADVAVKTSPENAAPVVRTIPKGQPIGVLYSWLDVKEGRSQLYFWFKDSFGKNYYTPYHSGWYDSETIEEQIKQKQAKDKPNWWENLFQGPNIAQTGLIAAGAFILFKAIK